MTYFNKTCASCAAFSSVGPRSLRELMTTSSKGLLFPIGCG